MPIRAALLLVLILPAAAQLGCATESPADQKELSGVVRDRLTRAKIKGATVTFTSDTLYSESTRTDGDGHYEMVVETDVALGQVRAEHANYQVAEATVYFDAPARTINLDLLPNPSE